MDDYIICIPSGEVIYIDDNDIEPLRKMNFTFFDVNRGILSTNRWVCSDFLAPKIKEYIGKKNVGWKWQTTEKERIEYFLLECGLLKDQYNIYDDMSVDAMGPVNMSYKNLKKIPVKFRRCTSDFTCEQNKLITLDNAPHTIHGSFNCSFNHLDDLKGGPRLVSGVYNCSNNIIMSLEGAPSKLRDFNCSGNLLRDLKHAPSVTGTFIKKNNLFNDSNI